MQRPTLVLFALTLALAAGAAQSEENFQRKSGLWEVKRTSNKPDDPGSLYQMCVDQATDKALLKLGTAIRSERCEATNVTRSGDTLTLDAVCQVDHGRFKATTHAVVTGKLDSAYKVQSNWTFDPPRHDQKEGVAVLEAKWTGACKPEQHAGDIVLPSGLTINVNAAEPKGPTPEQRVQMLRAKSGLRSAVPPTK
jgi:hypothetical protein